MKNPVYTLLLLLSLFLTACGGNEDDGTGFFPDAPANPDKIKLLQLINDYRTAGQNCGGTNYGSTHKVTWNDTLALVAQKHSNEMKANDKLSHFGTNGSSVDDRISAEGYVYTYFAENLLKGGTTEQEAVEAWKNSKAHCINLMDSRIKEIGVATSGPYWTMVLASH